MLVDDLRAITSRKLDRVVVEPFDPAQKPDPVHKKERHLRSVIAKVFQERVLED